MKIYKRELSPFPALESVTQDMLAFNATELAALRRTVNIMEQADAKLCQYYSKDWQGTSNPSLSDLHMDYALMLCTGYLRGILSDTRGLRLD